MTNPSEIHFKSNKYLRNIVVSVLKMPKGDHCAVFGCSNDRRYPEKQVVKSHVGVLRFHSPINVQEASKWEKLINRRDFKVKLSTKVCSNHFKAGYRSKECPNPTLFLKGYSEDNVKRRASPTKRLPVPSKAKKRRLQSAQPSVSENVTFEQEPKDFFTGKEPRDEDEPLNKNLNETDEKVQRRKLFINQATCHSNCFRYTGITRPKLDLVFDLIKDKAQMVMERIHIGLFGRR